MSKYQPEAMKCHSEMISKYGAVFGGFGIDKNGFNFRSNANNNSQVNDNKKWNTYGSINGFAQFMHLRERQVVYGLWLIYLFKGAPFKCMHECYSVDSVYKATERYLATGKTLDEEKQEAYPALA
jgi:hypothetical protein